LLPDVRATDQLASLKLAIMQPIAVTKGKLTQLRYLQLLSTFAIHALTSSTDMSSRSASTRPPSILSKPPMAQPFYSMRTIQVSVWSGEAGDR
jgi:hypothetical protein